MEEENENSYELQLELTVDPLEEYISYEYYEKLAKNIYTNYIIEGNKVKIFKIDGSIDYVTLEEYMDSIYKYLTDVMVFKSYWNIKKLADHEGQILLVFMIICLTLTYAVSTMDNNVWMLPSSGFIALVIKEFLRNKNYKDILLLGKELSEDVRIKRFSKSVVEVARQKYRLDLIDILKEIENKASKKVKIWY